MTSLRVSILCAAAVGYVFHSKCFAGSSRLHIPGLLVIFSLRALGPGLERSSNHTVLGWTPKRKWVGPWRMRTWAPIQRWNEKKIKASTSKLLERWLSRWPTSGEGGSLSVATLAFPAMGHVCMRVWCGVRQN